MSQTLALLVASLLALAALIAVKKHRWDPLYEIEPPNGTEQPQSSDSKLHPHPSKSPSANIIGEFYLDQTITAKWFLVDHKINGDNVLQFLENQPEVELKFDGKTFNLDVDGETSTVPYTPLEETETYLKVALAIDGTDSPKIYYIQWDNLGFWLSRYISFEGSEKTFLFRQRFVRL